MNKLFSRLIFFEQSQKPDPEFQKETPSQSLNILHFFLTRPEIPGFSAGFLKYSSAKKDPHLPGVDHVCPQIQASRVPRCPLPMLSDSLAKSMYIKARANQNQGSLSGKFC